MYDPKLHHRRSIRLRGYDYSSPGSYFVTICANDHVHLFGEIIEGVPHLNDGGKMIESAWTQMPDNYPNCQIGDFVIMPNHLHGIIILDPTVGAPSARTTREQEAGEAQRQWQVQGPGQAQGPAPTTLGLGDLVHRFKSLTTARYRLGTATHGWPTPEREVVAAQLLRTHRPQ